MSENSSQGYDFGPFRLYPQEQVLLKQGKPVDLTPKMFEVLVLLVKSGGHLLEREEIIRRVWQDTVVDENSLSQCVYMLRKALGDGLDQSGASFIETVPRRGYRFVAPVRASTLALHPPTGEIESGGVSAAPAPTANVPMANPKKSLPWQVLLGVGALLVVAALAFLLGESRHGRSLRGQPAVKSTAVLPFRLLTATAEDEYLSLGLADAIITKLSETRVLVVRPVDEVRKYSGKDVDALKAGRELGVNAVLEGAVQRDGETVRVSMRLLDTKSGAALWADQIDCSCANIFVIEDRVAYEVERALGPGLEKQSATGSGVPNATIANARQDYMKGRFFWSKRTGEGLTTAIQYFQQATELDPDYAQAYAGIADAYALLGFYDYMPPGESYPKAKEAALHALTINNNLPEPHVSLLVVATDYDWDWESAQREFVAAISLNPNDAEAYQAHAYLLLALGQADAAIRDAEKASQLDPLSPGINSTVAWAYYLGHDYSRCLQQCQRTRELYPDFVVARQVAALAYSQLGEGKMAAAELQAARKMAPENPITGLLQAQILAAWGRHEESREVLKSILKHQKPYSVSPYYVAAVYSTLEQPDDAFEWLDKAFGAHSNWLIYLALDPRFESLHKDPRFATLLHKVGLPTERRPLG